MGKDFGGGAAAMPHARVAYTYSAPLAVPTRGRRATRQARCIFQLHRSVVHKLWTKQMRYSLTNVRTTSSLTSVPRGQICIQCVESKNLKLLRMILLYHRSKDSFQRQPWNGPEDRRQRGPSPSRSLGLGRSVGRPANGAGRMESLNRIQRRLPRSPSLNPSSSNTDDDDVGPEEREKKNHTRYRLVWCQSNTEQTG